MIMETMRNALAVVCVKYMGAEKPVPELEFVMHPNKLKDAVLESRINNPELVMHANGAWTFRGVPIREDAGVSNWTLIPI